MGIAVIAIAAGLTMNPTKSELLMFRKSFISLMNGYIPGLQPMRTREIRFHTCTLQSSTTTFSIEATQDSQLVGRIGLIYRFLQLEY